MKVYALPAEVPAPAVDYSNYDYDQRLANEEAHQRQLAKWLKKAGYTGKLTGESISFVVGDGYARYMLADGRKSCLIHLPYGDAYEHQDVKYLPKKEIIRRLKAYKKLAGHPA